MENSDLIMRALQSHIEKLERLIDDQRAEILQGRCDIVGIARSIWPDRTWDAFHLPQSEEIVEELQRRGVMNGGMKP